MFKNDQPEANVQQALVSQSKNNLQSEVQTKRERRDYSLLQFCNSYCKPSTAAEQEATCKESTALAVKKEAEMGKKRTAIAVEREVGLCKKSLADAFNKTMAKEAKSCEESREFLLAGPFKASKNNRIGEIKKYYHNYEFSMDLRFPESALQNHVSSLKH